MKEKRKIEGLFVATMYFKIGELIEEWEQYETFGQEDHHIIITPKKRLVYSSYDLDGNLKYYDYITDKEVIVKDYESSYSTTSSCCSSLYFGYTRGMCAMPISGLREIFKRKAEDEFSPKFGYLVPFDEYVKKHLGLRITNINPMIARILLKIIYPGYCKKFELSFDEKTAHEQLEKIGLRKEEEKEKVIR
jgi:hypothetical protein